MKAFPEIGVLSFFTLVIACLVLVAGCGSGVDRVLTEILNPELVDKVINPDLQHDAKRDTGEPFQVQNYYGKFYKEVSQRGVVSDKVGDIEALDALPKDAFGEVSWTAAVVNGVIAPKASLDPNIKDEPPLDLNIFIEAKVPLMANVIFPHSIHTYWLSCNICHPKIFIPEAGANPISMEEIFKGEWCGRCHGKVAFTFWPRANCTRCHIILKGQSLQKELFP